MHIKYKGREMAAESALGSSCCLSPGWSSDPLPCVIYYNKRLRTLPRYTAPPGSAAAGSNTSKGVTYFIYHVVSLTVNTGYYSH